MTNEQYLAVLADLRNRQNALDQEKAQLNRGDRVRHTKSWACGEVLRADPAACVVRWDDGSECWALRGELEPCPPPA